MHRDINAAVCLLIGFLTAGCANATIIYDNTAGARAGAYDIGCLLSTCRDWANSFLTPAGPSLTLTSAGTFLQAGTETGSVTAYLYSSSGGPSPVPNASLAALGTFTHADLLASTGVMTFMPASNITLAPNTQYWIVLVGSGGQGDVADGRWRETNNNSGVGVIGQFHANWQGSSWFSESNTGFLGTPEMIIQVSAAAPEPATAGLIGLALAGLWSFRRYRRRRR
jgi:hypothetical protein